MLGNADEAFYDALRDDDPEELYESAPCGFLSTLPDGTIVKANRTFFTWTGHDPAAIVGHRRFQQLLPAGDRIFYETHYAPLLRMQGSVREIAVELVLADGSRLPVLANSVLKRDASGAPVLVRTVLFDARERRSYERELLEARRRAEESEAEARRLALTLQATFLPPVAVAVPGLDVGGAYRPAGDGSVVGGDFYDVFETGRGTHAVVLGDVSGKGVSAAVVTALARYTVRAEALRSGSPAAVLRLVHEAMLRDHPDRFCTMLLAEVRVPGAAGAAAELTLASAGHHLPLVTDGTTTSRVGAIGSIAGMVEGFEATDRRVALHAGQALVLYTDGLSEARGPDGWFGDERVASTAAGLAGRSAADVAAGLVAAALDFQGGVARDDIAVVVLSAPAP